VLGVVGLILLFLALQVLSLNILGPEVGLEYGYWLALGLFVIAVGWGVYCRRRPRASAAPH